VNYNFGITPFLNDSWHYPHGTGLVVGAVVGGGGGGAGVMGQQEEHSSWKAKTHAEKSRVKNLGIDKIQFRGMNNQNRRDA